LRENSFIFNFGDKQDATSIHAGAQVFNNDGVNWTEIATGSGDGQITTATFTTQNWQYIGIDSIGDDATHWYFIAEFNVYP
jgi:hypothetical protein